jgi:WD40 repeat protein
MKFRWIPGSKLAGLLLLLISAFLPVTILRARTPEGTKSSPVDGHKVLPSSMAPIWQLDVGAVGYRALEQRYEAGATRPQVPPLCFAGRKYAIVTFVTREVSSGLPRRDSQEESLPYRLHVLFVDAKSGELQATRVWPTASQSATVMPATGGNFLVLTPDKLRLYSPDLLLLNELNLQLSLQAHEGWWQFSYSPNGNNLLISYDVDSRYYRFQWIDLNDLTVLRCWQEDTKANLWKGKEDLNVLGGRLGSIYDDEMVMPFQRGFFLTRKLDGPWDLVRFTRPVITTDWFEFLNRHLLLSAERSHVEHGTGNITLIHTNGEVLFEQELSDREQYRWLASSSDGSKFAVAIERGKGGSVTLDIAPHYTLDRIMVYDVPARQWIYTIDGKMQGIEGISGLAVSPDGSLLALISRDGILKLYSLPRATSSPQ